MPEINTLEQPHVPRRITMWWDDPYLYRITRIRFVGDNWSGPFDLSYCHGTDVHGNEVRVRIPTYQVRGKGSTIIPALVRDARADGVHLKTLCGGDIKSVVSILW